MKTPKERYLARVGRSAPDRRGGRAFTRPRAARRKAVRAVRRAVRREIRRIDRTVRWQRSEAAEEDKRSRGEARA